jgi:hypothetical protein
MSKRAPKYLSNEAIEAVTAARIRQYEAATGTSVAFPVPIEKVVERVLGLDFDWDGIEEGPGEQILGGLHVESRKIYLNTRHLGLFESNPGLEHDRPRGRALGHRHRPCPPRPPDAGRHRPGAARRPPPRPQV